MARRKDIQGIANNLTQSFISRDNDVGGYWGVGKLYAHARMHNISIVKIELMHHRMTPWAWEFSPMIFNLYNKTVNQFGKRDIPKNWIGKVEINAEFPGKNIYPRKFTKSNFHDFKCTIIITDSRGHAYRSSSSGRCWPTDTAYETRRYGYD